MLRKVKIDSVVSKGSATKAEQHNILFESITSQKINLATKKHGKNQKLARLDFSGAKGVVCLSSDYYITDGDQAPTSKKGGLPACSKSAEPTAACPESTRSTTTIACPESARPTTPSTLPASAQVSLADFLYSSSC